MDVDAITKELQSRSRSSRTTIPRQVEATNIPPPSQNPPQPKTAETLSRPPSSLSSSVDIISSSVYPPQPYPPVHFDETKSQAGSEIGRSRHSSEAEFIPPPSPGGVSSRSFISESEGVSATTQSWVVASGSDLARSRSPAMSVSAISSSDTDAHEQRLVCTYFPLSFRPLNISQSASFVSVNTTTTDMSGSEFNAPNPNPRTSSDTRSKAELWNEVKMLSTFPARPLFPVTYIDISSLHTDANNIVYQHPLDPLYHTPTNLASAFEVCPCGAE